MIKFEYKVVILSVLVAVSLWFIDALVDVYVFYQEEEFWDSAIFNVSLYELYIRLFFGITIILFGLIIAQFLSSR